MPTCDLFSTRDPAAPAVPPPVIAATIGVSAAIADRTVPPHTRLPRWMRPVGLATLAAGIGLAAWGMVQFKRHEASPNPRQRPTKLVTDGPYAFTRNPMYLGGSLALLGASLMRGSVVGLISPFLYAGILSRKQIPFEEAALETAYGSDYDAYRKRVRRWI